MTTTIAQDLTDRIQKAIDDDAWEEDTITAQFHVAYDMAKAEGDTDLQRLLAFVLYIRESEGDNIGPDDVSEGYSSEVYSYGRGEYLVLTDDEADEKEDEYLDSYIDDCLEIPDAIAPYFDREKWKRDAKTDGRGHCLASYDGGEDESRDYYIYRIN